ncbi:MAG: Do family serine endopeptidase [Granulosicoccus sp.]|nr:Do family serine endopeptidase [Granulosicoccus sp.]
MSVSTAIIYKSRSIRFLLAGALLAGAVISPTHAMLPQAVEGEPLPSLAPMLEKVLPAVVNISTTTNIDIADHPLFRDPLFRQFAPGKRRENSLGSGVIVDAENGYILTNHHVIDKADEISVTTNDGRTLAAELVGSDSDSDVAVIQVNDDNLSAIKLGRSSALRVGDFVVAIGSPFGLSQTVTSGIVSALGRSGLGIEGYEDFIQTDASINPGNSGGALVNLRGELVGINTAILSRGGGSVGIGLSIPVDMVNQLMAQLVEFGGVERGLLGVAMQDLTAQLATEFGIPGKRGALVSQVVPGSAAEDVGMTSGDVIVKFNERVVRNSADLRNAVGVLRAGSNGTVEYYRDGKLYKKKVRIKGLKEIAKSAGSVDEDSPFAGATFADVRSSDNQRGVRVEEIDNGTPASETGLVAGDIILKINKKRIRSIDDLNEITAEDNKDNVLAVRVIRDGRPLMLIVQ